MKKLFILLLFLIPILFMSSCSNKKDIEKQKIVFTEICKDLKISENCYNKTMFSLNLQDKINQANNYNELIELTKSENFLTEEEIAKLNNYGMFLNNKLSTIPQDKNENLKEIRKRFDTMNSFMHNYMSYDFDEFYNFYLNGYFNYSSFCEKIYKLKLTKKEKEDLFQKIEDSEILNEKTRYENLEFCEKVSTTLIQNEEFEKTLNK